MLRRSSSFQRQSTFVFSLPEGIGLLLQHDAVRAVWRLLDEGADSKFTEATPPLKNDGLQLRMFRGSARQGRIAAGQKLKMIQIDTTEAKRAAFGKEMNGIFSTAGSLPF